MKKSILFFVLLAAPMWVPQIAHADQSGCNMADTTEPDQPDGVVLVTSRRCQIMGRADGPCCPGNDVTRPVNTTQVTMTTTRVQTKQKTNTLEALFHRLTWYLFPSKDTIQDTTTGSLTQTLTDQTTTPASTVTAAQYTSEVAWVVKAHKKRTETVTDPNDNQNTQTKTEDYDVVSPLSYTDFDSKHDFDCSNPAVPMLLAVDRCAGVAAPGGTTPTPPTPAPAP